MMKRLQILLVTLLFLHSKIGVAFNAHYCGNHIADISWAFDVKGCGMEKSNLSLDFLEKIAKTNCCEDDLIVEQNTSDQTQEDVNSGVDLLCILQPINLNITFGSPFLVTTHSLFDHPPPLKTRLYKKYCALVFYG
jgi:hypothetical protein